MVESIDMILEKVIAIEAVGVYWGGRLTSSPHDTEILRGSTVAAPSQTVRRVASVDGSAKHQATPVVDITVSVVGAIPSLE
jgi:hypothetical protein